MQEKIPLDMKNVHVLYAVLITVLAVGALIALVVQRSLLETPTQTAQVSNSAATFTSMNIAESDMGSDGSSLSINENSVKNIYVWGVANDNNGCNELLAASSSWSLKFYRSDTTPGNCSTTNYTSCYYITEATAESFATATSTGGSYPCSGTDTDLSYEFVLPVKYFTVPTDSGTYSSNNWIAEVTVIDYNSSTSSSSDTIEVAALAALDITETTIDYGTLALGGNSSATSANTTTTVKNSGNSQIDISVTGLPLTCSIDGQIAATQIKYDDNSSPAYASMEHGLTTSASTVPAFNLASQTTTGSSSTKSVYWMLQTPTTGASGTCSNTVTVSAVSG